MDPWSRRSGSFVSLAMAMAMAMACAASVAAELTVAQVQSARAETTASAPADFSGKDLFDIDLSGRGFRRAVMRRTSLFTSKLVEADFSTSP